MAALAKDPSVRTRLLGQAVVTSLAVARVESYMKKHLPQDHPVLRQLPEFTRHSLRMMELRLMRIGLIDAPLSSLSVATRARLVAAAFASKAVSGVLKTALGPFGYAKRPRLTESYLSDPSVRDAVFSNARPGSAPAANADALS
jgi:hypothetical protein